MLTTNLKSLLCGAAVVFTAAAAVAADTPADIAADYREKAAAALTKVNETLEKATVPLIADLVKAGDTAGADELKAQLKAKQDGEPVMKPHAKAAALFKSYDTARAKALEPAQKSAVSRIDALLASSDGKKLEVVTELGKVRAEIEAGKAVAPSALAETWNYHMTEEKAPNGIMTLKADGTASLKIEGRRSAQTGTWKPIALNTYEIALSEDVNFTMKVHKDKAVLTSSIGTRYLTVATTP